MKSILNALLLGLRVFFPAPEPMDIEKPDNVCYLEQLPKEIQNLIAKEYVNSLTNCSKETVFSAAQDEKWSAGKSPRKYSSLTKSNTGYEVYNNYYYEPKFFSDKMGRFHRTSGFDDCRKKGFIPYSLLSNTGYQSHCCWHKVIRNLGLILKNNEGVYLFPKNKKSRNFDRKITLIDFVKEGITIPNDYSYSSNFFVDQETQHIFIFHDLNTPWLLKPGDERSSCFAFKYFYKNNELFVLREPISLKELFYKMGVCKNLRSNQI